MTVVGSKVDGGEMHTFELAENGNCHRGQRDLAMGQVGMVCALNGENAKFGIKPTADRLVPQSLER